MKTRLKEQVRIVEDVEYNGVYTKQEALDLAEKLGLNLIEVNSTENYSVCKIYNIEKDNYKKNKQLKKQKALERSRNKLHEIKLSIDISENDLKHKAKKTLDFLKKSKKVLIKVELRKRNDFKRKHMGEDVIEKFKEILLTINNSVKFSSVQLKTRSWNCEVSNKQ